MITLVLSIHHLSPKLRSNLLTGSCFSFLQSDQNDLYKTWIRSCFFCSNCPMAPVSLKVKARGFNCDLQGPRWSDFPWLPDSTSSPCLSYSSLATLAFLWLFNCNRHVFAPGPLHLLLFLPARLFLQVATCLYFSPHSSLCLVLPSIQFKSTPLPPISCCLLSICSSALSPQQIIVWHAIYFILLPSLVDYLPPLTIM